MGGAREFNLGPGPPMTSRWRERVFVYFVPLCLLYLVTMWGLWHIPNILWGMYGNTDGWWLSWNIRGILHWGNILDLSPFNPLSGMGSTFAPYLPWLNPGALSLGLPFPKDLNYLMSYSIYFIELCISNIILLRILGLSPVQSSIGAQIYVLVLFPPTAHIFVALPWYSLAPVNAHLVAVANLTLALFLVIGPFQLLGNLTCAAGMLAFTLAGLFSAPILFLTYAPTYSLAGLALLLGQRPDRRALLWKVGSAGAVATILWLLGFPDYLGATGAMSARSALPPPFAAGAAMLSMDFWLNIWRRFDLCGRSQELLCNRFPVFWFHALALGGATIQLFKGRSLLRPLAAWFLFYIGFTHFYEFATHVLLFGKLHVVSTPYLVWSSYPFSALFLVVFGCTSLNVAARALPVLHNMWQRKQGEGAARRRWAVEGPVWSARIWSVVYAGLSVLIVPGLAYYLWAVKIAPHLSGPRPNATTFAFLGPSRIRKPVVGPVTRDLIEHASLGPGSVFHGYTVSYFGDMAGHIRKAVNYRDPNMSFDIYVRARQYLDQHYGNRFQETDLWELNIPTFEEYGQWVTRQAYVFATELFSSPGDEGHHVILRVYRLDLDLLPALGVRFLITDMRPDDPRLTLRATEKAPTAGPIYLYEIPEPNLATYSPSRAIKATSFAEALALIRQHRMSLRTDVVVFEDLPGPFRPARRAELRMVRDGFRITAESDGRSLVLVPVQFSRCFRMQPARPAGDLPGARLLRANAVQTLLEFEGRLDAQVRFQFGLLGAAKCRLRDVEDLKNLELKP